MAEIDLTNANSIRLCEAGILGVAGFVDWIVGGNLSVIFVFLSNLQP